MRSSRQGEPVAFCPGNADELIGHASKVAKGLLKRVSTKPDCPLKILLYGPPGVGKTCIAGMVARSASGHPLGITEVNGKLVNLDVVKEWICRQQTGNLFTNRQVILINEVDRCSRDAQDLLLTLLDEMAQGHGLIATSNLELERLTERFQTRFQAIRVSPPKQAELFQFLKDQWPVPAATARRIAQGAKGNVRAALADLQTWIDCHGS